MAGIILKSEWMPLLTSLPDEAAGQLIKAIAAHVQGDEPDLDGILAGVYRMMTQSIDESLGAYEARCAKSRASAQERWSKARQAQEEAEQDPEDAEKPRKRRKVRAVEPDPEVEALVAKWNEVIKPITGRGAVCTPGTQKEKGVRQLIKAHGLTAIADAFEKIASEKGWITEQSFFNFDWATTPENLDKILQGNFSDRTIPIKPIKPNKPHRRVQAQLS